MHVRNRKGVSRTVKHFSGNTVAHLHQSTPHTAVWTLFFCGRVACASFLHFPWDTALERREVQARWLIRKNHLLKKGPFWKVGNQTKAAGDLHGWARSSRLNSDTVREGTRSRSRGRWPVRNIELPSDLAGMGLGMPRLTQSWIWQKMWRATRKASIHT